MCVCVCVCVLSEPCPRTTLENGKISVATVISGDRYPRISDLDTNHAFILDAQNEMFVWLGILDRSGVWSHHQSIGKRASTMERVVGRALAKKFLSFDRPEWTPIIESNSSIACRQ